MDRNKAAIYEPTPNFAIGSMQNNETVIEKTSAAGACQGTRPYMGMRPCFVAVWSSTSGTDHGHP